MPTVFLRDDRQEQKDIEIALRKLKKKVEDCNILKEVEKHSFYERPGDKRKRKLSAAKQRWKRELAKSALGKKMY